MKLYKYILILMAVGLVGCHDDSLDYLKPHSTGNIIHVGGVLTDGGQMVVTQTRAVHDTVRAETVPWMQGALRHGLDITYSNENSDGSHHTQNEAVAILKWLGTYGDEYVYKVNGENVTVKRGNYTFKYKGTEDDAEWYDNGPHYFEGEYVPDMIRQGNNHTMSISDLTTNQANDADYEYSIDADGNETTSGNIGNYTLLSHYVGMPPNWTASATVDQILLPFKHRLARVIVYILIDDQLLALDGSPAVLEGYKGTTHTDAKDDPSTTSLRFANVKVLQHVEETAPTGDGADKKTSTLVPRWTEARRVIPHFCDEFNKCYKSEPDADYPTKELAVPSTEDEKYKTPANAAFLVYTNKRDEKKLHPRESGWLAAHKDFVDNGVNSTYTQQAYHRVPIYDVIVRPTYEGTNDVMYDEAGYYNADKTPNTTKIAEYAKEKNQIEFEMTLNNGLVYTKVFEFDLNANQQTVVYITIDRESIDYDESKSEPWTNTSAYDGYYGVNNDLGHNMSIAGSSWQRAVTFVKSEPHHNVTDGNFYDDSQVDDGDLGQYFSDDNQWIEEFAKANMGGERQGHYFVLDHDITIDATKLPDSFVFTGHLDGRGHKITLTNVGDPAYIPATNINNQLYTKSGGNYIYYRKPEHLYERVVTYSTYSYEEYITLPGNQDVTEDEFKELSDEIKKKEIISYPEVTITLDVLLNRHDLYEDNDGNTQFQNPTSLYEFSHTSASHLFAALNGTYDGNVGQYNLHKESGDKTIPVKGYRAELYNTTVVGGTFFPTDAVFCGKNLNLDGATVTGYIYNCFDINHVAPNNPLTNVVPIPEY